MHKDIKIKLFTYQEYYFNLEGYIDMLIIARRNKSDDGYCSYYTINELKWFLSGNQPLYTSPICREFMLFKDQYIQSYDNCKKYINLI